VVGVDPRPVAGRQVADHVLAVTGVVKRAGDQLEQRVPGRLGHRGVESRVGRQHHVEAVQVRVEQRRPNLGQVCLGAPGGGQPGRRDLQGAPQLEQVGQPDTGRVGEQRQSGGERFGQLLGVRMGHEAPTGDASGGHDQMLAGEQPQRLAHRASADAGPYT
jgi:hypothetical protein